MLKFKLYKEKDPELAAFMLRDDLRVQACRDLAQRSFVSISAYFVIWLIIYYTSELEHANDTLLEFLGFMLAAVGVGRLYLAFNFQKLYADNSRRWRWLFATGTLMSAAIWGGVCALALDFDGLGTSSIMVMLSTAGIASGGIISLKPANWLGGIFIALLLFPVIPFALLSGNVPEKGVALLFLAFFIFMFFLWRLLHTDYWRAAAGRAELVRAKEAAEAATLAKGQFIASVSHELRTPLTSIIGALGMIESYQAEGVPEQTMKLVDMAYQNGKRLSVLINDLLDFEKLNANRMEFHCQPMKLRPFLVRALELNHSYAENYRVFFVFEQPPSEVEVIADEHRLMQVMTNLLSNAAKHSLAGENVLITVKQSEGKAQVAVRDRGAGVPESFRQHVFEKFAQAESSSTHKTNGTGLGLAISKAIIEQMGGTIGFDSVVGQGSVFYFELPLAKNHQPL
jgi:signal transduction histidine kinase